jgi:hypothetical protein
MDGPPSQSLGVDPVDRDAMRRPPRPKSAPILTRRLMYRVAFSAGIIICGVLFVLAREHGDGSDLARDQTMVRFFSLPLFFPFDEADVETTKDLHLFRLPRPRLSPPKPRSQRPPLLRHPEQNAPPRRLRLLPRSTLPRLHPLAPERLPDPGVVVEGSDGVVVAWGV